MRIRLGKQFKKIEPISKNIRNDKENILTEIKIKYYLSKHKRACSQMTHSDLFGCPDTPVLLVKKVVSSSASGA